MSPKTIFLLIFVFPLLWGMVIYVNEFETKKTQKLTENLII